MSTVAFRVISDALRNCCSGIRALLFTRLSLDSNSKRGAARDINCDLSDKKTFFAWQRNHTANERTFLSWCRTGISLIGFGFLIERFDVVIREMRFLAVPGMSGKLNQVPSTRFMGMVALGLGVVHSSCRVALLLHPETYKHRRPQLYRNAGHNPVNRCSAYGCVSLRFFRFLFLGSAYRSCYQRA